MQSLGAEGKLLKLQMSEVVKVCNETISLAKGKERQAKMLESRFASLKAKLDLLKRKEMTGGDMKIVGRKVANVEGEVNQLVEVLHRGTFESYANIRHKVDQTKLAVGSRLIELIDRKAQGLQWSVHTAPCNAVGGVNESFAGVPKIVDRSLHSIVGHAVHDESAKLGLSSTHSSSRESLRSRIRAISDSWGAPQGTTPQSTASTSPGATDPCDYPGRC